MEIPARLQQRGIKFVLLEVAGKKPIQKEWQNKLIEFDNPELLAHIQNNGNYGVMGGGEKCLIIIDFDNERIQNHVISELPPTFTIKTGRGLLHKYFFSERCESFKIFDEEMNTLADVQGEGKQVVGAGSIHPNGNSYEIADNSEIAYIPYAEVKALLMQYDKKPKKAEQERKEEKVRTDVQDNFLEDLKSRTSMKDVLQSFGITTSKNPTQCYFHSSNGGKCMGFNKETAHCFHCDGSWNIFSFVKEAKHCDFKEALEYLANISGMQDELQESRRRFLDNLNKKEKDFKRDMKLSFLAHVKDKEYSPATEILVDYIEENNFIYTTKNDIKSEMWIYRDGIYTPNGRSEVKEIVRGILGDWYSAFHCNQILNKIEADTFIDTDKFFQQSSVHEIPVKNGILNILTGELKQFNPEKVFFNKLPVEYNPLADCPLIEKFLKDVLANEDDIQVFFEMGGFTLLKEYKFEKAFMFIGTGRNGKDKTLELIKRTIGAENCCSVPLSMLSFDNFIISEFFGKLANLSGEISNQDLKETGAFKQLTGRSLVTAQRKFLTPITFQNFAKFVFACNDLPMVYDMSKGFWDRWVLLEFPYSFVTKEDIENAKDKKCLKLRDEGIIDKITTPQEISGLLNKFLEGLDRLIQLKNFSSTKGSEDIKNLWIRKANSFMAFCLDYIQDDYEGYISKKELRKKYKEYCINHKITGKNDFVIKRTLEEMFGAVEERRNIAFEIEERVWVGIKLKDRKDRGFNSIREVMSSGNGVKMGIFPVFPCPETEKNANI